MSLGGGYDIPEYFSVPELSLEQFDIFLIKIPKGS
jgi:hypothetical protein